MIKIKSPSDVEECGYFKSDPNGNYGGYKIGFYHKMIKDVSVSVEIYDNFFQNLKLIYGSDFSWYDPISDGVLVTDGSDPNCYFFKLKNFYLRKDRALKEYNFPGCKRGLGIRFNNFSIFTYELDSLTNFDVTRISGDDSGYIYTYQNIIDFELDLRRWIPDDKISVFIYDIKCLKKFCEYNLGYRYSVEDVYKEVKPYIRMDILEDDLDIK